MGNWSKHPLVRRLCDELAAIEGASKKTTPQRCFIKLGDATLATLGVEKGKAIVEFKTSEDDYAAAHGSPYVRPHPLKAMAMEGWLQAEISEETQCRQVLSWILSALEGQSSD